MQLSENDSLLRLKQVLQLIPVSKATWYNGMQTGRFPAVIKNGRCSFWRKSDILKLINQIADAADNH